MGSPTDRVARVIFCRAVADIRKSAVSGSYGGQPREAPHFDDESHDREQGSRDEQRHRKVSIYK